MTEVVQKRLELMTGELEEMRRTKLFNAEETRVILKKRKEFEYKINALTKECKSFTDYINYEKCLLKDIQLRRDKYKVGEKKGSIEHKIIKRIKLLYEVALQRFPDEMTLFPSFLKFCKKVNYVNAASDVVMNMVKRCPDKPEIWQIAANWHAYDRKDINEAIVLLLKGITLHKESKILYREMIEIELYNATANSLLNDKSDCVRRLEEIIKTIFMNVSDFQFYVDLLQIMEDYSFTLSIQNVIIDFLVKSHYDNELLWHTLAEREHKGAYYSKENKALAKMPTPKARFEAAIGKYKQGFSLVSDTTKPKLWDLYLDFLMELHQYTTGGATVLKTETLKSALIEVAAEGCLSEKHYMVWLELVNDDEALQIVEKGTNALPQSLELWKARLRLQISKNEPLEVDRTFKMGIKVLKEKSLPLWSAILRYHYLTSNDDFIELIYKDGVKQSKEISDILKPQYLEWLALARGIDATRKAYFNLAVEKPYCKELHSMMSKLESIQIDYNFDVWISVHRSACEQFGKEDVDVWIEYIQFYLYYNKDIADLNERVQSIYKEAESTLPNSLLLDFLTKYKKCRDAV